jgi:hypothetical protein
MWQPIETAPKDGTPFLSYEPNHPTGGIDFAEWCTLSEEFIRYGCGWSRCTHWMAASRSAYFSLASSSFTQSGSSSFSR